MELGGIGKVSSLTKHFTPKNRAGAPQNTNPLLNLKPEMQADFVALRNAFLSFTGKENSGHAHGSFLAASETAGKIQRVFQEAARRGHDLPESPTRELFSRPSLCGWTGGSLCVRPGAHGTGPQLRGFRGLYLQKTK